MRKLFTAALLAMSIGSASAQSTLYLEGGAHTFITNHWRVSAMYGYTNFKDDIASIGPVIGQYNNHPVYGFRIQATISLTDRYFFFVQNDNMLGKNPTHDVPDMTDDINREIPYPNISIGAGLGLKVKELRIMAGVNLGETDPITRHMTIATGIIKLGYNVKFR